MTEGEPVDLEAGDGAELVLRDTGNLRRGVRSFGAYKAGKPTFVVGAGVSC